MSEKTKIMIFDTKEMVLIFFCIFFLILIAFVMGVKVGKKVSFIQQGFHESDLKVVDLKSTDEEWVATLEHQKSQSHTPENPHHQEKTQTATAHSPDTHQTEHKQEIPHAVQIEAGHEPQLAKSATHQEELKDEFQHLVKEESQSGSQLEATQGGAHKKLDHAEEKTVTPRDSFAGKYTIQLGSYQTEEEAMKFADGFKVRHYDPIIQEVHIEGKGVWYRVSLGIFPGMIQAKEYINKEESLFHGQDYVIVEFQ
jgi:hypothetical protein